MSKKIVFRYRFEVPKLIDLGSIVGSKKESILGPVFSNTLHTCPHGKHILLTYHNKEREARWNERSCEACWKKSLKTTSDDEWC